MEITKTELKILMSEFLSVSNRVLRAQFITYNEELGKFISFIDSHEVILGYVESCGEPEYDVEEMVKSINSSGGNSILPLGTNTEKEVANIYAVVKYLSSSKINGYSYFYFGYAHGSKKYQDHVDGFGNDVIRYLIEHIKNYLHRLSIEMGLEDKIVINVNVNNSKNTAVNVATEGSVINSTQAINDAEQLQRMIEVLLNESVALPVEDQETVKDCVEVIKTATDENSPKAPIKIAAKALKAITGSGAFCSAVTSIIKFLETIAGIAL